MSSNVIKRKVVAIFNLVFEHSNFMHSLTSIYLIYFNQFHYVKLDLLNFWKYYCTYQFDIMWQKIASSNFDNFLYSTCVVRTSKCFKLQNSNFAYHLL